MQVTAPGSTALRLRVRALPVRGQEVDLPCLPHCVKAMLQHTILITSSSRLLCMLLPRLAPGQALRLLPQEATSLALAFQALLEPNPFALGPHGTIS